MVVRTYIARPFWSCMFVCLRVGKHDLKGRAMYASMAKSNCCCQGARRKPIIPAELRASAQRDLKHSGLMPQVATFLIPALDCPDELALIEKCLRGTPGIVRLSPDYFDRKLRVEFDAALTTTAAVRDAIATAGFPVQVALPVVSAAVDSGVAAREEAKPTRTLLAGTALLIIAAALHFFVPNPTWFIAAIAIAATIIAGLPVARAAWRALRLRALDMNVLMTVAAAGAIAIGDYFEAATAMCLFALSLWLERLSIARAQRAVRSLVELTPQVAHRLPRRRADGLNISGDVTDIDPAQLQIGDELLVRPGERMPADGIVLSGQSAVNQAPITGESAPVEKLPGQRVFAGTLNGEGALTVLVARLASDTTLAQIARLIDEARSRRSPTERFVDAFARRYTPAVIGLALLVMVVPPLLGSWGVAWAAGASTTDWIQRGLVLLVIACPCALVISTPVTIVSALHAATRAGILVKGGEFLERAGQIRRLALDKTGTVTSGQMELVGIEAYNGHAPEELLAIAAGLERHSEHPLAAAITKAAAAQGLPLPNVTEVSALRGLGVRGELAGEAYFLGNARLFSSVDFALSPNDTSRLRLSNPTTNTANTIAYLGTKRRLLGQVQLADRPRPGTREAIAKLRQLGVEQIVMLTGDNAQTAARIAQEVGITEVHAELLPQDKIDRVRGMSGNGMLAMIGDGVNDAPALAAADVGIALGGQSSDTALETADVVIMSPELGKVATLIRLSRRARTLLQQNIAFSIGTKLVVIALAAVGYASMWMAVAADVGASLLVIANGMRMLTKRDVD